MNRYVYAHNNGVNLVDPTGLSPTPLSEFFSRHGGNLLRNFYTGRDEFLRQMLFGNLVGSRIRQDIALQHPDHTVLPGVRLPEGRSKEAKYGLPDLLVVRPPMQRELYEIKPALGDSPNTQLGKYMEGLAQINMPAILGIFPYEGRLDNFPVVGVRIDYGYIGPGKIVYQPSANQVGQAMVAFIMAINLITQMNRYQMSRLAQEVAQQAGLQRGFLF
jgi:hypothetical protein